MEKTPKKGVERRRITASTLQGREMWAWLSQCQGVIPPFCYSWNNLSCRQPFLSFVCMRGLAQGRSGDVRSVDAALAPLREGRLCATQQTERSLLAFFPSISRAVELCRCADSKCPLLLGTSYCTEARFCWESLVFKKENALWQKRRSNVSGSLEFRLP